MSVAHGELTVPDGMSAGYNDGDGSTGDEGVLYQSPSMNGWTLYLSHGLTAGAGSEIMKTQTVLQLKVH